MKPVSAGPKWDALLSTVSAVVHGMGHIPCTIGQLLPSDVSEARSLTPQQSALLSSFDQLNEEGQQKAVDYVDDLVLTGRYKKYASSGLGTKEA